MSRNQSVARTTVFILGLFFTAIMCLLLGSKSVTAEESCRPITPEITHLIENYVSARFDLAPDLDVEDNGLLAKSCYRRLLVHSAEPNRLLVFYLSPDQHYLSPDLMDLASNLVSERRRMLSKVAQDLVKDESPTRGPNFSSVTVVEFSDFECPYCKQLSEYLSSLAGKNIQVRIVFKHVPSTGHSWARSAANASVCAAKQGNEQFWKIHDFFFANQGTILNTNFAEKVSQFLESNSSIDQTRFRACMTNHESDAVVTRDVNLAESFHVAETPTLFINGRRKRGVRSEADLRASFEEAMLDNPKGEISK